MANKKNEPEFTVTDRRRFFEDTEADESDRAEAGTPSPAAPAEAKAEQSAPPPQQAKIELAGGPGPEPRHEAASERIPDLSAGAPRPSEAERAESDRAYRESTGALDDEIRRELGGQPLGEEFKTGFDRIVEPLYVTALVQMGFMGQEGETQRRVDIVGARQSIDALSLLQEKTKGNLTPAEARLLEDIVYDLRMKYLEITNALARAVQNPPEGKAGGKA